MAECCELLENCGFFLHYRGQSDVVKHCWIDMFCESEQGYEVCARKAIREQTGEAPADNLTPTGVLL
ncbi:hypothetical protein ACFL6U_31410 [Planctomycetota bacterium]